VEIVLNNQQRIWTIVDRALYRRTQYDWMNDKVLRELYARIKELRTGTWVCLLLLGMGDGGMWLCAGYHTSSNFSKEVMDRGEQIQMALLALQNNECSSINDTAAQFHGSNLPFNDASLETNHSLKLLQLNSVS
jgi:hypothetical protein